MTITKLHTLAHKIRWRRDNLFHAYKSFNRHYFDRKSSEHTLSSRYSRQRIKMNESKSLYTTLRQNNPTPFSLNNEPIPEPTQLNT